MKTYEFTKVKNEKTIEVIVNDNVAMINHMILPEGDRLPLHNANSNVYMIVTGGEVTLELNESEPVTHEKGTIINIEYGILMNVYNAGSEILELFVVKAPGPASYKA